MLYGNIDIDKLLKENGCVTYLFIKGSSSHILMKPKYIVYDLEKNEVVGKGKSGRVELSLYEMEKRKIYISWLEDFSNNSGEINKFHADIIFDYKFVPYYGNRPKPIRKIPVFRKPRYYPGTKYRFVPGYGNLVVSKDGEFFKIDGNNNLSTLNTYINRTRGEYPYINTGTDNRSAHILVALAWCEPHLLDDFGNPYYGVVDHIDANKTNYKAENLRWITQDLNTKFTVNQGVNSSSEKIIIRNIETGSVEVYDSITLASKAMGRSRINTEVTPLVPGKVFETYKGKYEVRYYIDGEKIKWWYNSLDDVPSKTRLKSDTLAMNNGKMPGFIKITCPGIGTKIFTSYENFFYEFLKCEVTPENIKNVEKIFKARYPSGSISLNEKREYEAKNILTGQIVTASTTKEMGEKIGMSKSSVIKYCGKPTAVCGWIIRPMNKTELIPWPDFEENIPVNAPMGFEVTILPGSKIGNPGDVMRFPSFRKMCRQFKWKRSDIKRHLLENGVLVRKTYSTYNINPLLNDRKRVDLSTNNPRNSKKDVFPRYIQ